MGDSYKGGPVSRDVEQAITVLKKGATLLKYGRRGKPKFCPFRLCNDESALIWYCEKVEKQLKLGQVSRIIPGQRTAIFQRYPRPDKEYQSFSLIYGDRSLDLICKDKDEAEVWFVALEALISKISVSKWRNETRDGTSSTDSSSTRRSHRSVSSLDGGDAVFQAPTESSPTNGLWKALSNIILNNSSSKSHNQSESSTNLVSLGGTSVNSPSGQSLTSDNTRVSLSSAISSSSHGSCHDDFESAGDVFIWGEGIGEGILGGGNVRIGDSHDSRYDALLPMALETTVVLDVKHIACGDRHAVLVTRQGEIFSWGEEVGGRLGHGTEVDVSIPKLIDNFSGNNVELVACGEYHTCAVTTSGDLFTWGDGSYNSGMLGHGSEVGHWIPKRVCGPLDGMRVSHVSCGPWHSAVVVSTGQLFTFGDGTFGVLGHGDRISCINPREVESLRGLQTVRVACGTWHTAAIVEVDVFEDSSTAACEKSFPVAGKLFTWGEGDNGQLGHGDKGARLVPEVVAALTGVLFCKVACGCDLTVALTTSGRVYTMGNAVYGQLGCSEANEMSPVCVEGKIADSLIEDIACGSHHVAVLTSKAELFTWGKGTNGQLGHGDTDHRNEPTFVDFMKDKLVKSVVCGSNFTAVVCFHNWIYGADYSACTGCHNPFGIRRKRHHCYNCGHVFCRACSSHKSLKASLAPNMSKPYRVCDDCFVKLNKVSKPGNVRIPRPRSRNSLQKSNEGAEKETLFPKFSDLPFVSSFKRNDSGRSKGSLKLGKVGSFPSVSSQVSSPSSTPILGYSNKRVSASAPGSRRVSRAASPVSYWFSPVRSLSLITSQSIPTSLDVMTPNTQHSNDNLRQEVIHLKAEVEELTGNNHLLEAELEKTRKQLKETKAVAVEEAEKTKSAKEVIKSLTAQLKMAERAPEGNNTSSKLESSGNTDVSHGNNLTSLVSPRSESNIMTMDTGSINGGKEQAEITEWVVQDEPGVYISLCSLVDGGNELKRVRFSRKLFSEEQAEKWWAENSVRVFERHNIRSQAV